MIRIIDNPIITSPFGMRTLQEKKQFHYGVDLVSKTSTTVYSPFDGKIILDFDDYKHDERFKKQNTGGNYLVIKYEQPKPFYLKFVHLEFNFYNQKDYVTAGKSLGIYADVGYSFGAHLHISTYDLSWLCFDPQLIFTKGY